MSEEDEKNNQPEDSPSFAGESSALSAPESAVEEKLEAIIDAVPAPQREEVRHTIRQFLGFVERSSPRIDPEVARILAASNDKDNENKFKYLTRKQELEAEESKRDHDFERIRHTDQVKLFWPILITVLFIIVGGLSVGIYLAATGYEILGASLLTGIFGAVFGYLAGIGTADFFKSKKPS